MDVSSTLVITDVFNVMCAPPETIEFEETCNRSEKQFASDYMLYISELNALLSLLQRNDASLKLGIL